MDNIIGIAILVALCVCIVLLIILLVRQNKPTDDNTMIINALTDKLSDTNSALRQEITTSVQGSVKMLGDMVSDNQKNSSDAQNRRLDDIDKAISQKQEMMSKNINEQIRHLEGAITDKQALMNDSVQQQMKQLEERFKTLETTNEQKLNAMRETISQRLSYIQEDNNRKLDEMRKTVDDKLQKTLDEKMASNFKLVSERLEQVHKGLGEMQNIASSVGDLKKVLSHVKTRGILGEIQLGAILSEILTSEQYDTEIATIPNSRDHVEYAIKLPANDDGGYIYLPIDSKFPGDTYAALQDAYDSGNADDIKEAVKTLKNVIRSCAKDIHDKYICPPYTTNFAIMFLPFEGLYAEVVNSGLVEELQHNYSVNIAGPSTTAAMLNSLQMGFKTLQIQKRSSEVWDVLSAVKTEFDKFESVFASAQNRIRQLDEELNKLVGTRTRAIQRKLRDIQTMDSDGAQKMIGTDYGED